MTKTMDPTELGQQMIPSTELKDSLARLTSNRYLCILTGPSASGKSYLASKVRKNESSWFSIDAHSKWQGSKWTTEVSPEEAQRVWVVFGSSDNLVETILQIVETERPLPLKGIALVFIMPDHKVFTTASALKAREEPESKAASYWLANSKLSETAMKRQVLRKRDLLHDRLSALASGHELGFESLLVLNTFDGTEVKSGWHGKKNTTRSSEKGGGNEK